MAKEGLNSIFALAKLAALQDDVQLQPHQQRIIDRMSAGDKRLLLYHGLGSGKSLSSLAAAEAAGGDYGAVTPASLRQNYEKEIEKFTTGTEPDVLSYSGVGAGKQFKKPVKTTIFDEAHRLRNPGTAATQAAKRLAQNSENLLLLTGTPITNHPSDLASLLGLLHNKNITPEQFEKDYVGHKKVYPTFLSRFTGKGVGEEPYVKNEGKLRELLKGKIDYQASKTPEGVNVKEEVVKVPLSVDQQRIQKAIKSGIPPEWAWKLNKEFPLSRDELKSMNSFLTGLRQSSLSTLPFRGDKKPLAAFDESGKLQQALKDLKDELKSDPRKKAITYSNYIDAGLSPYAAALEREKIPYGMFHGGIPLKQRKQTLQDYNEGKLRALLLGPAAAEGISTKGTNLIQLLDPHWHESRSSQARGRGLRFDSHTGLPEDLKNVAVKRYISESKEPSWLGRLLGSQRQRTGDEILQTLSADKEKLNDVFRKILQEEGTKQANEQSAWNTPILVSGHSGSGKSTLAQKLSERTGLPLVALDDDSEFKAFFKNDPDNKHLIAGSPENAAFRQLRQDVTQRAFANIQKPAIVEGTQLAALPSAALKQYLNRVYVQTPKKQLLAQRLERVKEKQIAKGKPWDDAIADQRNQQARKIYDRNSASMRRYQQLPGTLVQGSREPIEKLLEVLRRQNHEESTPVKAAAMRSKPISQYVNTQTFSDSDGEYSVADLLALAQRQPSQRIPMTDLLHNLEPSPYESGEELPGDPAFVARAQRSDRRHPGIAVKYPDGVFLADGVHRLWKANAAGKSTFPAYVLTQTQLKPLVRKILQEEGTSMKTASDSVAYTLQNLVFGCIGLALQFKHCHWNVRGPMFKPLHDFLDEVHETLEHTSDDLAERLVTLDHPADGNPSGVASGFDHEVLPLKFMQPATIVDSLTDRLKSLCAEFNVAIKKTSSDPVTSNMLQDMTHKLEKHLWMLRSQKENSDAVEKEAAIKALNFVLGRSWLTVR